MIESKKKKKGHTNYVVEQKMKVDVLSVLATAVEKYGAKKILRNLSVFCTLGYAHYTDSMAITLADRQDIENSETGKILFYVMTHWEEMVKLASNGDTHA